MFFVLSRRVGTHIVFRGERQTERLAEHRFESGEDARVLPGNANRWLALRL
jgi:hypothetical protein